MRWRGQKWRDKTMTTEFDPKAAVKQLRQDTGERIQELERQVTNLQQDVDDLYTRLQALERITDKTIEASEDVNPYLLHGEELARAEARRKAGVNW
jgi:TolA-binding protein